MKEKRRSDHEGEVGHTARASQPVTASSVQGAEQLFREHARFVAAFLHRLGVQDGELDDLVQEVFIIAHRKGGFLPQKAQPRTWLGAIAIRIASEARRARGRRREDAFEQADVEKRAAVGGPEHDLELAQSLHRVQRALYQLDEEHRLVFVMFEIEGESAGAIAGTLGIPVGTVYSRLHHARRRFTDAHAALAGPGDLVDLVARRKSGDR